MCAMQFAELGSSVFVTSSKYTNGLCLAAYSPLLTRGQVVPLVRTHVAPRAGIQHAKTAAQTNNGNS
jgi:hypothetical protein